MKDFTTGCTSYSNNGFIYRTYTAFYGDNPDPAHGSKGAWSHEGILFKASVRYFLSNFYFFIKW